MNSLDLIWLIPLLPAAGFVINGLFGKRMPKTAVAVIASGAVLISFLLAASAVYQLSQLPEGDREHTVKVYEWINAGPAVTTGGTATRFVVDWGFLLDPLSSVMVLVVTGIGFLGAGVILTRGQYVMGLTTAAVIWVLAAIGACIGFGYYGAAIALALVTLIVLNALEMIEDRLASMRRGPHRKPESDTDRQL